MIDFNDYKRDRKRVIIFVSLHHLMMLYILIYIFNDFTVMERTNIP